MHSENYYLRLFATNFFKTGLMHGCRVLTLA